MDASMQSMLELLRSELAGYNLSLSSLKALLRDSQFWWVVALVVAFCLVCAWDDARSSGNGSKDLSELESHRP